MGDINVSVGSVILIAVLLVLVGAAVGIFISNYISISCLFTLEFCRCSITLFCIITGNYIWRIHK